MQSRPLQMSLLADTLGAIAIPARAPVTHSAPELDPSRSEWVRACHSAAPPLRYLHPAQNRPNPHIRHIHRYTGITPKTGAKSYFSCLCWDFKGTCVDLVGSERKKIKGRMIKMTDVLGFEWSWTMFFLCALVPLPVRSDITCASCLAPIRRNEAHAKPTAFISRDFGSAPDGSTEWKWRLDGAQLSPEAHKKSPFVSWREKLQNAHISRAERTSPAEEKDGKFIQQRKPKWTGEKSAICIRLTARPVLGSSSGVPEELTVPGRARGRTSHTWSRPPLRCPEIRLIIRPWCCGPDTTAAWV